MSETRAVLRRKGAVRFCVFFVLLSVGLYGLLYLDVVLGYLNVVKAVTKAAVGTTRFLVEVLGVSIKSQGSDLIAPTLRLRISDDCNGMIAFVIYIAAVLAFPSRWRDKGIGVLLGSVVLWILNIGRIMLLVYTALYCPKFFYEMHIYVAQSIVIATGIVLWFFWAEAIARFPHSTKPPLSL